MVLDYTFERQLMLERKDRLAEGYAEGCSEGKMLQLIEMVCKKFAKGCTTEETAAMLEESVERVAAIYYIIENAGTDDINEIYSHLK